MDHRPAARADGHAWRARACAVLTGIGTVLADNPRLDVRDVPTERQPALVLVDSALAVPWTLLRRTGLAYIYTAVANEEKRSALGSLGTTG